MLQLPLQQTEQCLSAVLVLELEGFFLLVVLIIGGTGAANHLDDYEEGMLLHLRFLLEEERQELVIHFKKVE
jgi:hypothetical protein